MELEIRYDRQEFGITLYRLTFKKHGVCIRLTTGQYVRDNIFDLLMLMWDEIDSICAFDKNGCLQQWVFALENSPDDPRLWVKGDIERLVNKYLPKE